jgi:predicted ester cyclase
MTTAEVLGKMEEAFNAGDRATYMACASPDIVMDEGQFSEAHGLDAWAYKYDASKAAFPDAAFGGKIRTEQGEYASAEVVLTGTHMGTLRFPPEFPVVDIAPTGKRLNATFAAFARVVDDRIVSISTYGQLLAVLSGLDVEVTFATGAAAAPVKKHIDAWNAGDKAAYMSVISPDLVQDEGRPSERHGEEGWAQDWQVFKSAFPDNRIEILSGVEQGDRYACLYRMTGTQTGPLVLGSPVSDVAPTGRPIDLTFSAMYRVKDGLIASENLFGGIESILPQLGLTAKWEDPTATA